MRVSFQLSQLFDTLLSYWAALILQLSLLFFFLFLGAVGILFSFAITHTKEGDQYRAVGG